jgi:predicted DNA-binding protein (MmcQ/YjbR family)
VNISQFDEICRRLPGTKMVIQWGESHVWKVGEKMFALGNQDAAPFYVIKTTPLSYQILLEQGIAARAPYLPRGNWVRIDATSALEESDLKAYIATSHGLVAASLTRAMRHELGID